MRGRKPEVRILRSNAISIAVVGMMLWLGAVCALAQVRIVPRPTPTPAPAPAPTNRPRPAPARPRVFMEFVQIPAGEFTMGAEDGEGSERPPHPVRLTTAFEMGKFEVTQRQWKEVMDTNPSYFAGEDRPIDNISWDTVQEFIKRLNAREDGYLYRLPTEAEWEYACRAGTTGDLGAELGRSAWYGDNSGKHTAAVGAKRANAWGLHDMHGNVAEWVQDWFDGNYYKQSPAENPPGPPTGITRTHRGCSFDDLIEDCRASARRSLLPNTGSETIGFRLVRTPRQ